VGGIERDRNGKMVSNGDGGIAVEKPVEYSSVSEELDKVVD
jgi:hypothetical protein